MVASGGAGRCPGEIGMFIRIVGGLYALVSTCSVAMADDADKAKAMLERVAIEVKKDHSAAIQMFTKGEYGFRDGYIYPFCFRIGDGLVVTGQTAGQDIRTFSGATGQKIFDAAQRPEPEITELEYLAPKPGAADPRPVRKITFVRRIGEFGCGVGYYP
jgi:hypothetical protein